MTTAVPADVHAAARRVWLAAASTDDEQNLLASWAWRRWPRVPVPKNPEALAFWVLSIAYQDGVSA